MDGNSGPFPWAAAPILLTATAVAVTIAAFLVNHGHGALAVLPATHVQVVHRTAAAPTAHAFAQALRPSNSALFPDPAPPPVYPSSFRATPATAHATTTSPSQPPPTSVAAYMLLAASTVTAALAAILQRRDLVHRPIAPLHSLTAPVPVSPPGAASAPGALAATPGHRAPGSSRRTALLQGVAAAAALTQAPVPATATATGNEDLVDVYFGVGCFWHVQHEFVEAERRLLGRSDEQLTAFAGYAGGNSLGKDPRKPNSPQNLVCYHNFSQVADYGKLGHAEAVGMRIPKASVGDFAREYFQLFDKKGDRPDKGDRGPEYRSIVGLPGGMNGELFAAVKREAEGLVELKEGVGNDPDTLGRRTVWVYDSTKFPFHLGEVYHQYHDGFMPGEDYPPAYNNLKADAYRAGRLAWSGCPDIVGR